MKLNDTISTTVGRAPTIIAHVPILITVLLVVDAMLVYLPVALTIFRGAA